MQTMPEEGEGNRVIQYGEQVRHVSAQLKAVGIKYLATDGYYTKKRFMQAVEGEGLYQIEKSD